MNHRAKGSGSGYRGTIEGDLVACWMCGQSISQRALFCHHCGTVQPPRPHDPFTRLNLSVRFDIDPEVLERQYAGFRRVLDPNRFAAKGPRERAHAQGQFDALREAYETLRDPVRRARYLLNAITGEDIARDADASDQDLQAIIAEAADAVTLDRIAAQVTRDIETCIRELSAAFRNGDLNQAAVIVAKLERLDGVTEAARRRRGELPG